MKTAGLLLMVSGVLLLLGFVFQIPELYLLIKGDFEASQGTIIKRILYAVLVVVAGVFLIYIGRRTRKSQIN